jgi:hypothetical protein
MTDSAQGDAPQSRGEHFLPIDLFDLRQALVARAASGVGAALGELFELYVRLFHARLRPDLERLKRAYAPLRPDEDLLDLFTENAAQRAAGRETLLMELDTVLRRANYVPLTPAALDGALTKTSPHGLEVSVDLADYEVLRLYVRGRGLQRASHRHWRSGFTRLETSETPIYRRLFLVLSLEPAELHLKLFRDVPDTDLEMLLPNTRVRIRAFDKLRLGVTGGGGVLGESVSAVTKLSATLNPITACLAIAGLGGVLWRQVSSVLAQRTKYMAALKSRLYFHNLDNNQGALTHLVELAGEEECKEALLAYAFLLGEPCDRATLDGRVEAFLLQSFGLRADYEVQDGVRKLREAGLVLEGQDGTLTVLDPHPARESLARAWIELGALSSAPSLASACRS